MIRALAAALAPLLLAGGLLAPALARAATPPAPARFVTDGAGLLSEGVRSSLDARLEAYEGATGRQLLVWTGRSTGGVPLEDFAVRAFAAWRVGRKGIDDGLVLFVFSEDRSVRIEVGYGLEGQIPDAIASRVIRESILPRLQAGDPDGAIEAGVQALLGALDGRASAPGPPPRAAPGSPAARQARPLSLPQKLLLGLVGLVFLFVLATNPSLAIYLLFSILSGGRGGGAGTGGGGFSGGGGRSGGGGASGSW